MPKSLDVLCKIQIFQGCDRMFLFITCNSTPAQMESLIRVSTRILPRSHGVPVPLKHRTRTHPPLRRFHHDSHRMASAGKRKPGSSPIVASAAWFMGLGKKETRLPDIVKAGDPVLHEPAVEVEVEEIGSERIEGIIEDMVKVMRKAPGVGLAAPQIGVPLKIIVLEDTKEYISYAPKEAVKAQDRKAFDLLVIINPKLTKKSNKTALFFEGCLSVDGYRALVERHLEVKVSGLSREGQPIEVEATGWQARILQHECDHLQGTIYVDKMIAKTLRTIDNLDLPLAKGCPKLGVRVGS